MGRLRDDDRNSRVQVPSVWRVLHFYFSRAIVSDPRFRARARIRGAVVSTTAPGMRLRLSASLPRGMKRTRRADLDATFLAHPRPFASWKKSP